MPRCGGPLEQRREVARRRRGAEAARARARRPRRRAAAASRGRPAARKPTTRVASRPSSSGAPSATTARARARRRGRRAAAPPPCSAWSAGSTCRARAGWRSSPTTGAARTGSKPVVGSSRKIRSGSPTRPSARSSRRRWPPERSAARYVGAVVEPDQLEQLARGPRVRVGGAVELDRLAHADQRVQARLLQHDPDPRAERPLALAGVVAEHGDRAGVRAAVAFEDLHQGRLAGAVGAEQREHLAARDRRGPRRRALAGRRRPCAGRGPGRRRVNPSSCPTGSASRASSSSARGSNLKINPWVDGRFHPPMCACTPYRCAHEVPRPRAARTRRPAAGAARARASSRWPTVAGLDAVHRSASPGSTATGRS